MASTPLILALVVLTAIILVLLIIGVLIRYTRERRSRRSQRRAQLNRDAALAAEDAENSARLHCTYQPSGLPHGASHRVVDGAVEGVQLQTLFRPERSDSGDKAEIWLKRGASNDYTRAEHGRVADGNGRGVLGTKTVKRLSSDGNVGAWDVVGGGSRDNGIDGIRRVR